MNSHFNVLTHRQTRVFILKLQHKFFRKKQNQSAGGENVTTICANRGQASEAVIIEQLVVFAHDGFICCLGHVCVYFLHVLQIRSKVKFDIRKYM